MRLRWGRGVALLIAIIAIFSALYPIQKHVDSLRDTWPQVEELLYLPSGNMLKIVSLGFDEVAADILYIKMIDYFATHLMTDHTYTWLYHMADLVTTLDPVSSSRISSPGSCLTSRAGSSRTPERF